MMLHILRKVNLMVRDNLSKEEELRRMEAKYSSQLKNNSGEIM